MKRGAAQLSAEERPAGVALTRGGVPLRTPSGRELVVPTLALAEALTEEWRVESERPKKKAPALTRLTSLALDMAEARETALRDVLAYIETDVICYRASDPALAARQEELFAPLVQWAKDMHGLHLVTTRGVMPIAQPEQNREKLHALLAAYDDWQLAALAAVTHPLGSAVLGVALICGHIEAQEAFELAHLEEAYETEKWGADDEKGARLHALREEIIAAQRFLALLR